MMYLKLFWSFFQIGLFSFGGGYAAMPLIQNQVVDLNGWLTMSEFADVGEFHIECFHTMHDAAESMGYTVELENGSL